MTEKLRALTESPELQAFMERFEAAPPHERKAALAAFVEKAHALHPDWRETEEAARNDGRIVRALAIHCVLAIRARSDLDEIERFEAKTAEVDFITGFDQIAASPTAPAAFQMMLAFYELIRLAGLDPDEMKELRRQAKSAHGRPGGDASAETRRKKAERWQTWVTAQEPAMRGKHPKFSQEALADKLIDLALIEKVPVPDRSAVVKLLSALKRGKLSN